MLAPASLIVATACSRWSRNGRYAGSASRTRPPSLVSRSPARSQAATPSSAPPVRRTAAARRRGSRSSAARSTRHHTRKPRPAPAGRSRLLPVRMLNGVPLSASAAMIPGMSWYRPPPAGGRAGRAPPPSLTDGWRALRQYLTHVHLHDDLRVEVVAGVEVEVGVGVAGEARAIGMAASPVRLTGPAERHLALAGDSGSARSWRAPRGSVCRRTPAW